MHFLNFEAAIKSDQDLPFGLLLEVPFTTERKSYHHKSKPQSGNSSRKQKLIDRWFWAVGAFPISRPISTSLVSPLPCLSPPKWPTCRHRRLPSS